MENLSKSELKISLLSSTCSKCGCTGLHACTGQPIVWTEQDKDNLKKALANMFQWDKNGTNK